MPEKTKLSKVSVKGFKRIKAIEVEVAPDDLTVVGGRNRQGKTSFRDAIAWCLGGDKHKPSSPRNDDSDTTEITIILNDGTEVSRRGKNLAMSAKDSEGRKLTQTHINEKVSPLALDLGVFMNADPKKKATILLQCLGIGDALAAADANIDALYKEREELGRDKDKAVASHAAMPEYKDAPTDRVIVSDLLIEQKRINDQNAANETQRSAYLHMKERELSLSAEVDRIQKQLEEKKAELTEMQAGIEKQKAVVETLKDIDVSEVNNRIATAQDVNSQIEANERKAAAKIKADELTQEYKALTDAIEQARKDRVSLLDGAKLPLPGLDVNDGNLIYNGQQWDCMSDSERIQVSVAIAQAFDPDCGFANIGDIEALDVDTQNEVREWCKANGFQIVAARVSSRPEECTFIVEDGKIKTK